MCQFLSMFLTDFEISATNIGLFYVPRLHLNISKVCELPGSEKLHELHETLSTTNF